MRGHILLAALALAASASLPACARVPERNPPPETSGSGAAAPGAAAPPAGRDTTLAGMLRLLGPRETARLVLSGTSCGAGEGAELGEVVLSGPLVGELERLLGARVSVAGRLHDRAPPGYRSALEVRGYRLLEIEGQSPLVGRLEASGGRSFLVGPDPASPGTARLDTVELVGAGAELTAHAGAKVWVVGQRQGAVFRVRSYGIIRERSE